MKQATACSVALLAIMLTACGDGHGGPVEHKPPPPARIEGGKPESSAGLIVLTEKAVERLGIARVPVVRERIDARSRLPAEVVVPTGMRTTQTAAVAGRVMAAGEDVRFPAPLDRIPKDAVVLRIEPLLSPERQVLTRPERLDAALRRADLHVRLEDAKAAEASAHVSLDTAENELKRAKALQRTDVGSVRRLEEAQAQYDASKIAVDSAKRKVTALSAVVLDVDVGTLESLVVQAGRAGYLEEVHVSVGQVVPVGAPLFTIVDDSRLWLSVPVYVGELVRIDATQAAEIVPAQSGAEPRVAQPTKGLPRGDSRTATVWLDYALDNTGAEWRPGQRVVVRLQTTEKQEVLVVPWSAVVYDFNGDAWVYVCEGPREFRRRSVFVRRRDGDRALLDAGPDPGTPVVIAGAAELLGTEFGIGK